MLLIKVPGWGGVLPGMSDYSGGVICALTS